MIEKLLLLRGEPYEVNQHISINHPTLEDIERYGESRYWQLISSLTASSFDFRFQLDDMGFDYEDIDDFTVFCMLSPTLSKEESYILFGDIDFTKFRRDVDGEEKRLVNDESGLVIDQVHYELIVEFLRTLHGLKRNYKTFGNTMARKFYMEDERRNLERKLNEKSDDESSYAQLVSALVNCAEFKYDYRTVWTMPIYTFMDSVHQVQKMMNYKNLMTGIYTGNIDSKKIPKKQLTWIGDL